MYQSSKRNGDCAGGDTISLDPRSITKWLQCWCLGIVRQKVRNGFRSRGLSWRFWRMSIVIEYHIGIDQKKLDHISQSIQLSIYCLLYREMSTVSPSRSPDTYYYHIRLTGLRSKKTYDIPFNVKLFLYKGSQKVDNTRKVHTYKGNRCPIEDVLTFTMNNFVPAKRRVDFSLQLMQVGEEEIESTACQLPINECTLDFINTGQNIFEKTTLFEDKDFQIQYTLFLDSNRQNLLALVSSTPSESPKPKNLPPIQRPQQKYATLPPQNPPKSTEEKFKYVSTPARVTDTGRGRTGSQSSQYSETKNRRQSSGKKKTPQQEQLAAEIAEAILLLAPDLQVIPPPAFSKTAGWGNDEGLLFQPILEIIRVSSHRETSIKALKKQNVPGPQNSANLAAPTAQNNRSGLALDVKPPTTPRNTDKNTNLDDSRSSNKSRKKKDSAMKIKIIFGIIVLVLIVLGLSMIGSTKTKASRGKKKAVANKKTRK